MNAEKSKVIVSSGEDKIIINLGRGHVMSMGKQ